MPSRWRATPVELVLVGDREKDAFGPALDIVNQRAAVHHLQMLNEQALGVAGLKGHLKTAAARAVEARRSVESRATR